MRVERFIVTGGDNYNYLVISDKGKTAIAIDPIEPTRMVGVANEEEVTISHILITHGHDDHTGGAEELAEQTGARIIGHKDIPCVKEPIRHNDKRACETIAIQALETPGHTFDSICYLVDGTLYTGDTVFYSGAGNCFSGDADKLYESFSNILTKLPDLTKLYVGHEYALKNLKFAASIEPENQTIIEKMARVAKEEMPISTIGEERMYNPFFRFGDEVYREALEIKMNRIINDPKEVFLITRELRNQW